MFGWWFAYFFRALQTHDRQAVEPPPGVFVWLFDFCQKNTKKKAACPRIEPLFTANRGSISNKQRLCFIPTEPLFFYSFPQSHLLHLRGVTQNNIISVLQPPIQPKYHHTVQNTFIPAKKICTNSHSYTTFAAASDNVCTWE